MKIFLITIFFACVIYEGESAVSFATCPGDKTKDQMCPVGWFQFRQKCYFFQYATVPNLDEASAACSKVGARLLRLDDLQQASFVGDILNANAVNKTLTYYTAGQMSQDTYGSFIWWGHPLGKQSFSTALSTLWLEEPPRQDQSNTYPKEKRYIIYGYNGKIWGFYIQDRTSPRGYICEVEQFEVLGIVGNARQINYGQDDVNNVQRGPCIVAQPNDPWVFMPVNRGVPMVADTVVSFECNVYGNPRPSVTWYRVSADNQRILINALNDTRSAQTGYRLDVYGANSADDSDGFQCEAKNDYGSVMSRVAYITFSSVEQFENTERKEIKQYANVGQLLECKPPRFKPADSLKFQFYMERENGRQDEVLPHLRRNTFVSQVRGVLGFSDTSTIDTGKYICMITPTHGNSYGESQKSPQIPLRILEANQPYQKPLIIDSFPALAPAYPMRGDNVRIECFAYGSMRNVGLRYSWSKKNGNIPAKGIYDNFNRVLLIPNVDESDQGEYECTVIDFEFNRAAPRSVVLNVRSRPYFTAPPEDVYADLYAPQVTLVCRAAGNPDVSIRWYYNSKPVRDVLDAGKLDATRFQVTEGLTGDGKLIITNVQDVDQGLYGCEIYNNLGKEFQYSQLRVLSFSPNFNKYPVIPTEGMVGSDVIVVCSPEGAPDPTITWQFNGGPITTADESVNGATGTRNCGSKYCRLLNNNLRITNAAATDEGYYTCMAENKFGKVSSTAYVTIMQRLSFAIAPTGRVVQVNTTVSLPCRVQTSPQQDVIYRWFFEGVEIRFDRIDMDARRYEVTRFERPYGRYFGTLRIIGVSYEYDGNYTCRAETAIGAQEKWALIRVAGAPMPNSGIIINSAKSVPSICWTAGHSYYSNISYYVIEAEDTLKGANNWYTLTRIQEEDAIREIMQSPTLQRRCTNLTRLAANMQYRVRVLAGNSYGLGEASPPSDSFTTPSMPPVIQVQNVTGGGGKVQTLVVRWKPIDKVYYNAPNFRYRIHYRAPGQKDFKIEDNARTRLLEPRFNPEDNTTEALECTITLPKTPGYTPFEVAVSTANDLGVGPLSDIKTIYSAEMVPVSVPKDVYAGAVNSTALEVTWKHPVFLKEEGRILGYRIVYWKREQMCRSDMLNPDRFRYGQRQTLTGLVNKGVIIGLDWDQYYCIAVQVYNSAGDGPESSFYEQTTFKRAPQDFPTLVTVNATDIPYTVQVSWVGVQAQPQEESLDGYKIRWWQEGAPLKKGPKDVDCGLTPYGYIYGLSLDTRYNVRVFAYSRGGVGKLSSPMIQFTVVSASKCRKGGTYDGPDIRYVFICSACNLRISTFAIIFSILLSKLFLLLQ